MTNTTLVWFRQDLRIFDNPALFDAAKIGVVVPVFILDEVTQRPLGGAQRWWLYHSLSALQKDLKKHGLQLVLKRGEPKKILQNLVKETNATGIYWNRCYEPSAIARDTEIKNYFFKNNLDVKSFKANLLFEPWEVLQSNGKFYQVFTPFYHRCLKQGILNTPLPLPTFSKSKYVEGDDLNDWGLLPKNPDWSQGLRETWQPGESGAHARLDFFLSNLLKKYPENRDFPAQDATSKLSPHLHFGEISPLQIWHALHQMPMQNASEKFLRQIIWREFCYHLLFHFPNLPTENFREKFNKFSWQTNETFLKAWQRGQTGFPIIDAGMRELWHTGYMHNRVRMLVASFLTKNLLIHWREGEAWFWDTLVDADLANNAANWQWVAGSGADAAPYFRIFNPTLQAEKFDPFNEYIHHWVPELKSNPEHYPKPIVDFKLTRARALENMKIDQNGKISE